MITISHALLSVARRSCPAVLLLAAIAGPASGATIVQTRDFNFVNGPGGLEIFDFEGFDSTLGTLESVEALHRTTFGGLSFSFENRDTKAVNYLIEVYSTVSFAAGYLYDGASSTVFFGNQILSQHDGNEDFTGSDSLTVTQPSDGYTYFFQESTTSQFDLDYYANTDKISSYIFYGYLINASGQSTVPLAERNNLTGFNFGQLTLTYNYRPVAAAVPEPHTLALSSLSLAGIVAWVVLRRRGAGRPRH